MPIPVPRPHASAASTHLVRLLNRRLADPSPRSPPSPSGIQTVSTVSPSAIRIRYRSVPSTDFAVCTISGSPTANPSAAIRSRSSTGSVVTSSSDPPAAYTSIEDLPRAIGLLHPTPSCAPSAPAAPSRTMLPSVQFIAVLRSPIAMRPPHHHLAANPPPLAGPLPPGPSSKPAL